MVSDIREKAATRLAVMFAQHLSLMAAAEMEHRKTKQSLFEQSQNAAATASERVAAPRNSIARYASTYSSLCESLFAETTRQNGD